MKRRYPKSYIEALEEAILTEIVRTEKHRNSTTTSDLERRQEQQEPKHKTRLIADEIVRVYTVEITYIERGDPAMRIPANELNEQQKRRYMNIAEASLETMLRENGSEPDDVRCVRFQQFVTKAHEERE